MITSSRRNFLKSATAVTGGAVLAAGLGSTGAHADPESSAPAHATPFVAWVNDPKAGTVTVLVDHHELVITDKKLARKLAQAAARAVASA